MTGPGPELKRLLFVLGMGRREDATLQRLREHWERFLRKLPSVSGAEISRVSIGGVPGERVVPVGCEPHGMVLHLHGGAFAAGSAETHRTLAVLLAQSAGATVLLPEYRLAPEFTFPAALEDALASYRGLLEEGQPPESLFLCGDSAGAGLAMAALLELRDNLEPLPAAVVLLSPWVDLTCSGASIHERAEKDPLLTPEGLRTMAVLYLNGSDPESPLASPLFGSLEGLPPTLIQVGSSEILHDDAVRLASRMKKADVTVELEVWPEMIHVWHLFAALLPEGRQALDRVGRFLRRWV